MTTRSFQSDALTAAVARVAGTSRAWHAARAPVLIEQARVLLLHGRPPMLRDALGIAHREVPLNRTLGWLLNPRSDHGAEGRVLASFARWLGAPELAADAISGRVEAWCEACPVGWRDGRKPDLVFRGPNAALLVENKVFADEGYEQFSDYAKEFTVWAYNRQQLLVLLARDERRAPDPYVFRPHSELSGWAAAASHDRDLPTWTRITLAMLAADLAGADGASRNMAELRALVERDAVSPLEPDAVVRLAAVLAGEPIATPWSVT